MIKVLIRGLLAGPPPPKFAPPADVCEREGLAVQATLKVAENAELRRELAIVRADLELSRTIDAQQSRTIADLEEECDQREREADRLAEDRRNLRHNLEAQSRTLTEVKAALWTKTEQLRVAERDRCTFKPHLRGARNAANHWHARYVNAAEDAAENRKALEEEQAKTHRLETELTELRCRVIEGAANSAFLAEARA